MVLRMALGITVMASSHTKINAGRDNSNGILSHYPLFQRKKKTKLVCFV
jgi:hypothetical protein